MDTKHKPRLNRQNKKWPRVFLTAYGISYGEGAFDNGLKGMELAPNPSYSGGSYSSMRLI